MKKIFPLLMLLIFQAACFAQQETLDYVSYTPPAGWKKDDSHPKSNIIYSFINNKKKTWCQIAVYKATASKGSIDADFESEWEQLIKPLGVTDLPQAADTMDSDGWKIKNGTGNFSFNGSNASTLLTTISGYNVCFSVVVNTNSDEFAQPVQDFLNSVQLSKPENTQTGNPEMVTDPGQNNNTNVNTSNATTALKDKYAFNTTNWDDGWISTVQEDWVEVVKGNIRVLLHYPKEGTVFSADPEPLINAAWNILVAPRYSNIQNYKTASPGYDYRRPYLGMATLLDNTSGKNVFVVLFRRDAGWIEVVTPDTKTFTNEFGFDPTSIRWGQTGQWTGGNLAETNTGATVEVNGDLFNKLGDLSGRNKFAVAASDLDGTGKWSDHFSSNTFYTNIYTGNSAGMSTYSSSQWFEFGSGQSYKWELVAANSYGGRTDFAQAKGAGSFKSVNNWQLYFTEMEGKPKTYDVYFSVLKGKRVLWMNDASYPGSGIFTGFSKE